MKLTAVVGARPNFMKVAPIYRAIKSKNAGTISLIHTGQHYDVEMSEQFFRDLELPTQGITNLNIGSGSHAEQTGRMMIALEKEFIRNRPDYLVVVGDVNSTMAAALVASKLQIPIAHIEAGLRSFDRQMPEEINRIVTDSVSSLFFTTEKSANENLLREGIDPKGIHHVGNVMIDTLVHQLPRTESCDAIERFGLTPSTYVVATIHRPSNVDDLDTLKEVFEGLDQISQEWPIILPLHPRTKKRLKEAEGSFKISSRIQCTPPLGYVDTLTLMKHSVGILTDSGGIQEEAAYLRIPTLTLRPNTERPITIDSGTNQLVKSKANDIFRAAQEAFSKPITGKAPALWDGKTAERIVDILLTACAS